MYKTNIMIVIPEQQARNFGI